ncbi:MAG: HEAT repeat domain-containing protein, partial [Planctomycetes bacterium]|nr:HEAT repeat domain-containing protein [Planctomycetota bacterium]
IGTAEAASALAKAEADAKLLPAVRDAQLRCAEGLAAAGDTAAAEGIYRRLWAADTPGPWRLAALAGLARACPDKAGPLVAEALGADDPLLRASAMQLTRRLPGREVTDALVKRIPALDPAGQALVVDALADRGDKAAYAAVAELIGSKDEPVRAAAVRAVASLGDASCVDHLARLAATEGGTVQQAARASLVRLTGPDVDKRLILAARNDDPPERIEALRAMAARRSEGAVAVFLDAAGDKDDGIRRAAFEALGVMAGPDRYGKMVDLLVAAAGRPESDAAERAVLAVGGRVEAPAGQIGPVVAALAAAPAGAKPSLLRVLGGYGGPESLEAVRPYLTDADPPRRDAAVRALAGWPDVSAARDLLKIAADSDNATHRLLALRGYFNLARDVKDAGARLKMLEQVRPVARTTEARKMLLGGLADVADAGALAVAASFIGEADVQAEAAGATLKIGKALAPTEPQAVLAAVAKVLDTVKDDAVVKAAEAVRAEALKPSPEQMQQKALQHDQARSDARKKDLAAHAPQGYRLVGYLDCGPDAADGAKDGPALRVSAGGAYYWPMSDGAADARFGTVAYDAAQVQFEATGLSPKRAYRLGFSWWDCDHDTRVQSVWASPAKAGRPVRLLDKTRLPSGVKNEKPEEKTVEIPREVTADGAARLTFRNEATPNVV